MLLMMKLHGDAMLKKRGGFHVGNWFSGSRIVFVTALRFIYCWAEKLTSVKWYYIWVKMQQRIRIVI